MKKIIISLAMLMAVSLVAVPTYANDLNLEQETVNTETIEFGVNGLNFNTNYDSDDYYLIRNMDKDAVKYSIYNKNNEFEEAWSFNLGDLLKLNSISKGTSNLAYTNYKSIGAFNGEIVHKVVISVYSSGSFHQFNEFVYAEGWIEGWGYFNLDRITTDVRPYNGGTWPTQKLSAEYTAVVQAEVSVGMQATVDAKLLGAGFTFGGSIGGTLYYTKGIRTSYIIE